MKGELHKNGVEQTMLITDEEMLSDIDMIIDKSDQFIKSSIRNFDPYRWKTNEEKTLRRKSFIEVSSYLYAAENIEGDRIIPALSKLVVQRTNSRRYRDLLLRNSHNIRFYAAPLIYLYYRNELDVETIDMINTILSDERLWSVESFPHRMMEIWSLCQLFDCEACAFTPDDILKLSCLNNQPDIIKSDLFDAYALTHNLLYYHNFGVNHPRFPKDPAPYDVRNVVEGLILRYIGASNYDVALELTLIGVLQQQISPNLVRYVILSLSNEIDNEKVISGPDACFDPEDAITNDTEWEKNYHTNIVAGLAVRVIKRDWSLLIAESKETSINEANFIELQKLGESLHMLSRYNLIEGAQRLEEVSEPALPPGYDQYIMSAIEFLKDQKTPEDTYGFWTDEEILYLALGNDIESFNEKLVNPTTDACNNVLEKVFSSS